MARERVVEFGVKLDLDPAADDVVIQHEPRIKSRPQHDFAGRCMRIERV